MCVWGLGNVWMEDVVMVGLDYGKLAVGGFETEFGGGSG